MRRKRKEKEKGKREKGKERENEGRGFSPQVALAMSDGRDYEHSGVENRK